jgi:hypothetical protein
VVGVVDGVVGVVDGVVGVVDGVVGVVDGVGWLGAGGCSEVVMPASLQARALVEASITMNRTQEPVTGSVEPAVAFMLSPLRKAKQHE